MKPGFETLRTSFRLLAAAALVAGCASAEPPAAGSRRAESGPIVLRLQQKGTIGGFAVTPLHIEEDSRCPAGVQCIQAGAVRLAVRIAGRTRRRLVLALGRPSGLGPETWLTLCAVAPYRARPGPIAASAYRFSFVLGRGASSPAAACG
jgi:hypothetical protein